MPLLETRGIHTYYGDSHVLHGVSVAAPAGGAIAVLGRNGAGKSTLAKSIIGFVRPRDGEIALDGERIDRLSAHEIARRGIGFVPQGRRIFRSLTVLENLTIAAGRRRDGAWTLERVFTMFPQLAERKRNKGDQLSGGEQSMLSMARALMTNPRLLVMDEPSEGLSPVVIRDVGAVLRRVKEEGTTVLLIEQNVGLALSVADDVYILNKGKVVFHDAPAALDARPDVKRQYLGLGSRPTAVA